MVDGHPGTIVSTQQLPTSAQLEVPHPVATRSNSAPVPNRSRPIPGTTDTFPIRIPASGESPSSPVVNIVTSTSNNPPGTPARTHHRRPRRCAQNNQRRNLGESKNGGVCAVALSRSSRTPPRRERRKLRAEHGLGPGRGSSGGGSPGLRRHQVRLRREQAKRGPRRFSGGPRD